MKARTDNVMLNLLLANGSHYRYIRSMIVCICNRISESELRKAARSECDTPEKAYACVGCEVQCGCCLDYAQDVIDDARGKQPKLRLVA